MILFQLFQVLIKLKIEKENKNNVLKIEEILDILLKVLGYKLTINKSKSLIIETLEFINTLLESYKQNKLFLTEIESNILLNIFVDNLINNSYNIREMSYNLMWKVINMIGEELSLLKIMHLIEYKNNKTKIEIINIIVELYKGLLDKKIYNFDNWKIKIIKSAIILYFEKDLINKNKLIFIIKDLYLSFKNEIWKYCQNISLNNKEELIKIIGEKKYNKK